MVVAGVTWTEPEGTVKVPEIPEIVTEVAFCVAQVRVELEPGVMLAGVAWNTRMLTGLLAAIVTLVLALADSLSVFVTVSRKPYVCPARPGKVAMEVLALLMTTDGPEICTQL